MSRARIRIEWRGFEHLEIYDERTGQRLGRAVEIKSGTDPIKQVHYVIAEFDLPESQPALMESLR